MTLQILAIVEASLRALAEAAPATLEAILGGRSLEEVLDAADAAAKGLPVRVGGDGAWDLDLTDRLARGEDGPGDEG